MTDGLFTKFIFRKLSNIIHSFETAGTAEMGMTKQVWVGYQLNFEYLLRRAQVQVKLYLKVLTSLAK